MFRKLRLQFVVFISSNSILPQTDISKDTQLFHLNLFTVAFEFLSIGTSKVIF